MQERFRFYLNRLRERLWVRPLAITLLSVALVFLARTADFTGVGEFVPEISIQSIKTLLSIISASMLVIATFSVSSMVAAYASASSNATPRSFALIISDDVSQNALSSFIGAFIFSVVALIAVENSYYDKAGRFALFCLTLLFFGIVILTFVRWVDSIARLGRLGPTIHKVEQATAEALARRRRLPNLGGVPVGQQTGDGQPIFGDRIGYVQRIDLPALQVLAETAAASVTIVGSAGTFAVPNEPLAYALADSGSVSEEDLQKMTEAFTIGDGRTFDEDPLFGLIVLSEIASRALSPAVNDPGTAIDVIGKFVRLLVNWQEPITDRQPESVRFPRVAVPALAVQEMFDAAFTPIARDGAGTVEVAVRLQQAYQTLATVGGDDVFQAAVQKHARLALARAETAMPLEADKEAVRRAAKEVDTGVGT